MKEKSYEELFSLLARNNSCYPYNTDKPYILEILKTHLKEDELNLKTNLQNISTEAKEKLKRLIAEETEELKNVVEELGSREPTILPQVLDSKLNADLSNLSEESKAVLRGVLGGDIENQLAELKKILSSDDESLDTLQEIADTLKNGSFLENLPEGVRERLKGDKGNTGEQGEKGDPFRFEDFTAEQLEGLRGDRGYSAYEIWLGQGNEGTEQDFINSLKGEQRGEATATGSDFE